MRYLVLVPLLLFFGAHSVSAGCALDVTFINKTVAVQVDRHVKVKIR